MKCDYLEILSTRFWFFQKEANIIGIIVKCNGSGFQRTKEQREGHCVRGDQESPACRRQLPRVVSSARNFLLLTKLPAVEMFNGG